MKLKQIRHFVGGMAILLGVAGAALAVADSSGPVAPVYWAKIKGIISPATADYLEYAIGEASKGGQALIVELDTPGGLVTSTKEMAQAMDRSTVPVIFFVSPAGSSATSAGALLVLASHVAAMTPGTNIGAAHPVGSGGEDIKGDMAEKATNDVAAFARGLAEVRGRSVELAEEMVRKSTSVTAQEALKRGVIELLANDADDLMARLEGRKVRVGAGLQAGTVREVTLRTAGTRRIPVEMSWGQKLLALIAHPNIAALLLSIGVVLIYAEVNSPGLGVAGGLGAVCLIIAFISFQMLPIRVGGIALLVLGFGLIILEAFVTTHGALAVGGVFSLVLGFLWVIDPTQGMPRISPYVWVPIVVGVGGSLSLISWFAARSVRLAEQAIHAIGGGTLQGLSEFEGRVDSVSADGLSGQALIRGELWKFESDEPVRIGDAVAARSVPSDKMVVKVRKSDV